MNKSASKKIIISLIFMLISVAQIFPQETENGELDSAVKALRKIDGNALTDEDKKNKAIEINKAWEILKSSGDAGLTRIKKELDIIEKTKEPDDFFKLSASVLLWNIGNTSEASAISKIWNNTSFAVNYRYVFYTAFDAARTQNEKVIPMLKAVLKDNSGMVIFPEHSMNVSWPLTVEFIWGAFGHKGLPALFDVLKNSKNDNEIMSAMHILVNAQYLDALPKIRELAKSKNNDIRNSAIKALGIYGHPSDSAFIIKGLKSKDSDLYSYVWASCEYDEPELSPYLIPLLNSKDYNIRAEAVYALFHAITVEGLNALVNGYKNEKNEKMLSIYKKYIDPVIDYNKYDKMTIEEKNEIVAKIIDAKNKYYILSDDDKKITYNDFLEMSKYWIKENKLSGKKYDWVSDRHVLSVATAEDINILLDVKAAIYLRMSDECLYETRTIDNAIKMLGRKRYRNN